VREAGRPPASLSPSYNPGLVAAGDENIVELDRRGSAYPDPGSSVALWSHFALLATTDVEHTTPILRIFDVSRPEAILPCADTVGLEAPPLAVAVTGNRAYVALGEAGVQFVDLSVRE